VLRLLFGTRQRFAAGTDLVIGQSRSPVSVDAPVDPVCAMNRQV
jgi:hypothetical protein